MELFHAHKQWASRPADQRFPSLQALYSATKEYANTARELSRDVRDLRTEAIDGNVQLIGKANHPAQLTHWSFGQLATRIGAPASYLRNLPATLASQNLNYGLAKLGEDDGTSKLLFHSNGSLLLRAITSDKYTRIWNWEIAERLLYLESLGWSPATPDIRQSMGDFPALYASDHDMFAFVRNQNSIIAEPGNPKGLQRGVIVQNSEVGASALKLTRFLYREMCGNHIIWGASKVIDISVRHVGDARQRWDGYHAEIRKYANESAQADEAKIAGSRRAFLGDNKQDVLDKLFGIRSLGLSLKTLGAAYDAVLPDQDGSPNAQWGMVQGLTRHSQATPYADERTTIDKAAGKLMEFDF